MARSPNTSKEAPRGAAGGRRGRPTAERVAAIDAAIKKAALDLFIQVGFEAASMDAIAAAAKVSKGTLYARYDSKAPLFRAILEEQLEEWGQRANGRERPPPHDIEARLRHNARTIVAVTNWPEFKRVAALLDTSALAFPDLAREWDEIVTRRSVASLTHDMAEAGGPGVDWAFFAQLFHSAISGWHRAEASRRIVPDEETIAFADKVIDVMLVSIRNAQKASLQAAAGAAEAAARS